MFGIGLNSQDNTHLSLSLLKGGGQAASQLSHQEGRQLRCCEAPNQRAACKVPGHLNSHMKISSGGRVSGFQNM